MKENWTYKKLDEVCEINYGTRVVQKKDKGSTYYVYGGGGATFMVDSYNREDCFIVSRFAMSPKCTRFVKGKFFLNDSGLSVSPKVKELTQSFVDKVLLANNDTIYSFGKGMAQRNLDIPSFKNLIIPVPPIETQSRIVSELDLLQSIMDKQKAQLKELDNLAQAVFYDMFGDPVKNDKGWEVKKLGEICLTITDGDHMPPPKTAKGIPFLTISDINKETRELDFSNTFFVPQEYYEGLKDERKAQKNDLLYTVTGSYGIPVIVKTSNQFCFQRHIALIKPNNKILLTPFLCYWFLCPSVKKEADLVATGIAQKTVSLGSIRKFVIILPPLSLQQSFAAKIESIEKQKTAIGKSIEETQKLFDYTMDKYFG